MLRWGRCRVGENANLGKMSGVVSWGGCQVGEDAGLERMPGWRGCWVCEDVSFGRIWVEEDVGLNN